MQIDIDHIECMNCKLDLEIIEDIPDEVSANESDLILSCPKCKCKIKIRKIW